MGSTEGRFVDTATDYRGVAHTPTLCAHFAPLAGMLLATTHRLLLATYYLLHAYSLPAWIPIICTPLLSAHTFSLSQACGAAVAVLLSEELRPSFAALDSVLVVVCGGSGVDWSIMQQWRADGLWG